MESRILLDTNAFLRYLLCDNEEQYIITKNAVNNNRCFILPNVLQEAVYVLEGPVYNAPRQKIYESVLETDGEITYIDREIIIYALNRYVSNPGLDFTDCLLWSYKDLHGIEVLTFDKKLLNRMNGQ